MGLLWGLFSVDFPLSHLAKLTKGMKRGGCGMAADCDVCRGLSREIFVLTQALPVGGIHEDGARVFAGTRTIGGYSSTPTGATATGLPIGIEKGLVATAT